MPLDKRVQAYYKQDQVIYMNKFDLHYLLSPLDMGVFFKEYYEKEICLIKRENPNYFNNLINVRKLDVLISEIGLRSPEFRLIKNGQRVPLTEYTYSIKQGDWALDGVGDLKKIKDFYFDGATIIIDGLHRRDEDMYNLCKNVEQVTRHKCQINAYVTPKFSHGLSPHYDTHDVFLLQISGKKRWRIYSNRIDSPDASMRFKSRECKLGDIETEFNLETGDLLYMPRGVIHEGLTLDTESCHVTLGVKPHTWHDVFQTMLSFSREGVIFRHSVDLGLTSQESFYDKNKAVV